MDSELQNLLASITTHDKQELWQHKKPAVRKASGSQHAIGGVGDIVECIEQRAVEIKDGGAKRHIYRPFRKGDSTSTALYLRLPEWPDVECPPIVGMIGA